MFQTGFPSIIWSSKLHIQRQVFVRPLLLPAGSQTFYMFQTVFQSIIRSSKLHIQRQAYVRPILLPAASSRQQTEINELRKATSCWLYSENILGMHGPMNVNPLTPNDYYSGRTAPLTPKRCYPVALQPYRALAYRAAAAGQRS